MKSTVIGAGVERRWAMVIPTTPDISPQEAMIQQAKAELKLALSAIDMDDEGGWDRISALEAVVCPDGHGTTAEYYLILKAMILRGISFDRAEEILRDISLTGTSVRVFAEELEPKPVLFKDILFNAPPRIYDIEPTGILGDKPKKLLARLEKLKIRGYEKPIDEGLEQYLLIPNKTRTGFYGLLDVYLYKGLSLDQAINKILKPSTNK